jgi:hypothetical protein
MKFRGAGIAPTTRVRTNYDRQDTVIQVLTTVGGKLRLCNLTVVYPWSAMISASARAYYGKLLCIKLQNSKHLKIPTFLFSNKIYLDTENGMRFVLCDVKRVGMV